MTSPDSAGLWQGNWSHFDLSVCFSHLVATLLIPTSWWLCFEEVSAGADGCILEISLYQGLVKCWIFLWHPLFYSQRLLLTSHFPSLSHTSLLTVVHDEGCLITPLSLRPYTSTLKIDGFVESPRLQCRSLLPFFLPPSGSVYRHTLFSIALYYH